MYIYMHTDTHTHILEHNCRTWFSPSTMWDLGSNSGDQTLQQAPLLVETSCWSSAQFFVVFRQDLTMYRLLACDLVCRPGWPTHWNYHVPWSCHVPLASASQLLGLQACSTTSGSIDPPPLLWHISLTYRIRWISWTLNPAREESSAKWNLGRFTGSSIWIKPWRVGEV